MEVKDIAIIVLAMIVVLLIGFMLGQRRKNSEAKGKQEQTHARLAEAPPSTVTAPPHHDTTSTPPPSPDYSQQLSQLLAYQKRVAVLYAVMTENGIYASFNEAYSRIDEAYQRYDTNKQEHTREELLTLLSSILEATQFENIQKDLTTAARDTAKSVIDYYDEQLDTLFAGQPFENLSGTYRLNADLRISQLEKISARVMGCCSAIIAEAKDVAQHRLWLQNNYQGIVHVTSTEMDWGSVARNFGAGALAVANPLIGIPALIVNYKHQSDKSKTESAQVERYFELFDEFENKINSLREQIIQSANQAKDYIKDKCFEVNGTAIAALVSEIAANGCILDHYFESLDLKELEDAERKLFNEGV